MRIFLSILFASMIVLLGCSSSQSSDFEAQLKIANAELTAIAIVSEANKQIVPEPTATSTPEPTATSTPEPTATSTPEPTVTSTPTPEPTVTSTPTPEPVLVNNSELTYEEVVEKLLNKNMELKLLALNLINADRLRAGLNKLELGTNPAAQIHAEDSAKNEYLSHWMLNGEKPYQVYSRSGGDSYVAENGASGGWTKEEYEDKNCDSTLINCHIKTAEELIYIQHDSMMNDDLICCNNSHRDNILNPSHLKVNIGIESNDSGRFHGFYQHFEGGHFTGNLSYKNDYLSIVINNITQEYKFSEFSIAIYYDPLPENIADEEGKHPEKFDSYGVGCGYAICEKNENLIASILEPLPPNISYSDLESTDVIASKWQTISSNSLLPPDKLTIQANMSNIKAIRNPGIYTVLIWGDNLETGESEVLIELSFIMEPK